MPHAHAFAMGTEHSAQAPKKAPKRITNSDDDEEMNLLGYPKQQSNDAVSITKPGSARPNYRQNIKPYGGSFRPMNTLSTSNILPDQTQHVRPSNSNGKQHMLAVDVSRGYNVPENQVGDLDGSFEAPRSAKRQKLVHESSTLSSSSESLDAGDVKLRITRYGKSPAASSRNQAFAGRGGTRTRIGTADEYRGVEGMMDSNPRSAKRSKANRPQKASSPLMNAYSRNSSVETIGEDEHITAETTIAIGSDQEDTGSRQPELLHQNGTVKSDRSAFTEQTHSRYFQQRSKQPSLPTYHDQDLRSKFINTEGRNRGNMDHLSSDELDGPATLGVYADVIPMSPHRRCQPMSSKNLVTTEKTAGFSVEEQPVERSNIKATIFSSQAPDKGKISRQADFEDEYLDEEEPSWAVPLVAVNLPGQEIHKRSDMQLVYDDVKRMYFVEEDGKPLKISGSSLEIYLRSLQRCLYEESGRRLRFESSKKGTADNILDLEFHSEKNVVGLMLKIQGNSTNVKSIIVSSERMRKMFENRQKQPRPTTPIENLDNMPDDVQLMAKNQQRQEVKDLERHETSNTGRRRTKLTNGLTHIANNDSAPNGFMSNSALRTRSNGHLGRITTSSGGKALDRPSVFDILRPAHNDHLRRSTRTSSATTRYLEKLEEPEEPKVEKYSVKFGLGNKWSKPLSYPKVGKKKATVEWEDLERLDEGEFLNDNLVSFYMRYLEQEFTEKSPELAKSVYFFNSFFYDRLTTTHKGQKGINYEGVQRWTRGVDLFAYDYVVVPINELAHWYVAIICNLPALDRSVVSSNEPSSPVASTDDQLAQKPEDANVEEDVSEFPEKQARESFAELSLDSKPHKRQLSVDSLMSEPEQANEEEVAPPSEDDHEMLDVPGNADESFGLNTSKKIEEVDPVEDTDEGPRPATLTKKQKRKSILPSITKRDPSDPAIITFDSFGHPHSHVIKVLKQYLYEEGKAKRGTEFNVSIVKGITAKSIPQQSNFSDCGLYMLGYVEKFLEDHPRDFIPKIIKREYDDREDWPKMVPSNMRRSLREQLQKLHEEDQTERRENAIKAGKYPSGSRNAKVESPTLKKESNCAEQSASEVQTNHNDVATPKPKRPDAQDQPPLDVQQIRNATYHPSSVVEEDHTDPIPESKGTISGLDIVNEISPDRSLVVIESQTQPEVTSKDVQLDVPSSQPSQPPTPKHTMCGPSPILPNEIQDSQPSQLQIAELNPPASSTKAESYAEEIKAPGDLALSPAPPHQDFAEDKPQTERETEKQPEHPDMLYSNWKPPHQPKQEKEDQAEEAPENPPLPPRSRKKGTAQRVPPLQQRHQQLQRGKKMTKEEAIVLDD